jgi:transcriptional regulator of acetoin/glycerol metabolism
VEDALAFEQKLSELKDSAQTSLETARRQFQSMAVTEEDLRFARILEEDQRAALIMVRRLAFPNENISDTARGLGVSRQEVHRSIRRHAPLTAPFSLSG